MNHEDTRNDTKVFGNFVLFSVKRVVRYLLAFSL
jgi:hypothetical protein